MHKTYSTRSNARRAAHYTVTVRVPHEEPEVITTIAHGPISAVSSVTRLLADRVPAHLLKSARFSCRSGAWFNRVRIA